MTHRIGDRVEDGATAYSGTGNITFLGAAPTTPTGGQTVDSQCTVNGDTIDLVLWGGAQWSYERLTRVSAGVYSRAVAASVWNSSSGTGVVVSFSAGAKVAWGDVGSFFAEHLNTVENTITSAATLDIGALRGKFCVISGTTGPTTSLGTSPNKERYVRHSGSIWTCNTTSLILRGMANGAQRTNIANAISHLVSDVSGNWRELSYDRPIPASPLENSFGNLIINGGPDVSQELGTSGTTLANNTSKYFADMIEGHYNHGAATAVVGAAMVAITSLPGYPFCAFLNASTALSSIANGDFGLLRWRIEGYRMARCWFGAAGALPVSYGLWIFPAKSGTLFLKFSNSDKSRNYYVEHAVTIGQWQYLSGTVPGDTSGTWLKTNGTGLIMEIFAAGKAASPVAPGAWTATNTTQTTNSQNLLSVNGDNIAVSGVTIIPGIELPSSTERSSLLHRTFDIEHLLCQRYWEKTYDYGQALGGASVGAGLLVGNAMSTTQAAILHAFKKTKRSAPAITLYSFNGTQGVMAAVATNADTAASTPQLIGDDGFGYITSSSLTAGAGYHVHSIANARLS